MQRPRPHCTSITEWAARREPYSDLPENLPEMRQIYAVEFFLGLTGWAFVASCHG